ncbi:MAG: phosphoadenylyl-sulfate reductase [Rubrivivax sp.]|nr:phosphoadenylyl-sulfate reductase [Rubrivivax sp.]
MTAAVPTDCTDFAPVSFAGRPAATLASAVTRYGRHTPGHEARVAATLDRLQQAATRFAPRIVLASSLGAEDMVLTDLIARHRLPIVIATLDTGTLHAETLALVPRVEAHYGIAVERWAPPGGAVAAFVLRHGERSMFESIAQRQACCALRKLEPLARMLASRCAWVTGLRRGQSAARAEVPDEATDDAGRTKLNPLAAWSEADVWHYIGVHGVPYNPLHDRFFPSIGCAPCTRAVALGEDARAGRWWWEQESTKECGLHKPHAQGRAEVTAGGAETQTSVPA